MDSWNYSTLCKREELTESYPYQCSVIGSNQEK